MYNMLVQGLGLLIGPVVGSFLYWLGGYKTPLFTLGGMYAVLAIILFPIAKRFQT